MEIVLSITLRWETFIVKSFNSYPRFPVIEIVILEAESSK